MMIAEEKIPAEAGFDGFGLGEPLRRGVAGLGFTRPRPIQEQTIPAALEGRDVLGLAQTGTGKTAAFALPILDRLLRESKPGVRALILAPTRELAKQIETEIRQLAKFTRIRTAAIYGGVSMGGQIEAIRRGPQIIVACPGRLLDLLERREIRLDGVSTLVLDEADHMFDMGFLPDIRRVIAALPERRQNLMFSATMPVEIRGLADKILRDPHVAELANTRPPETIEHALYPIPETAKMPLLKKLVDGDGFVSAIVFTRTKHRAKRMALQLSDAGFRAVALQGNMTQGQRDRAMRGFRTGQADILVATDIAARGLDIANVSHVINFDIPDTPDAYTHRIGRTGRAERQGKAFTFVTHEDLTMVWEIERKLGSRIPVCKVEGHEDAAARFEAPAPARRAPIAAHPAHPSRSFGDRAPRRSGFGQGDRRNSGERRESGERRWQDRNWRSRRPRSGGGREA